MRVFLDTNIILDYILEREPSIKITDEIINLILSGLVQGYTSTNCLTDIFYISSKKMGKKAAKDTLFKIIDMLIVISVDCDDCAKALELPITDFEDAIAIVCANKADVEYIITNDNDFPYGKFGQCKIISPEEFLKVCNLYSNDN